MHLFRDLLRLVRRDHPNMEIPRNDLGTGGSWGVIWARQTYLESIVSGEETMRKSVEITISAILTALLAFVLWWVLLR